MGKAMVCAGGFAAAFLAIGCVQCGWAEQSKHDKPAQAESQPKKEGHVVVTGKPELPTPALVPDSTTEATVTAAGQTIPYNAIAGSIVVGSTDEQDATLDFEGLCCPTPTLRPSPARARRGPGEGDVGDGRLIYSRYGQCRQPELQQYPRRRWYCAVKTT